MRILSVVAVASVSLVMGVRGADDLVITEPGTTTLPSGAHTYGQIRNEVSANEVTVAQEGTDWNTFSGFTAVNASTTKLDNVRFDFGTTSSSTLSFFPENNTGVANRLLEIDNGSVVKNVGCLIATRSRNSSDRNNAIRVTGASQLSIAKAVVCYYDNAAWQGAFQSNNGASFTLDGGSTLDCTGAFQTGNQLSMGDGTSRDLNVWTRFLGSGTTATIGGALSIGGESAYGGHHGVIADGARVTAKSLTIGGGNGIAESFKNSMTISNGGVLGTTGFSLSGAYKASAGNKPTEDVLAVLDGGVYTNTGDFVVGYASGENASKWGAKIIVSNGTFRTSGGSYKFGLHRGCSNNTFIVSGPKANVTLTGGSYYYFCGGPGNRYVFENEVDYTTGWSAASYVANVTNEEICVRTGAKFRFGVFRVSGTGDSANVVDSRFIVESGAVLTGNVFRVGGNNNTLAVSNALVYVNGDSNYYHALDIGDAAVGKENKNAHLVFSGNAPRIVSPRSANFANGSDLTFNLPPAGYEQGIIPIALESSFNFGSTCSLNLAGAEEMMAVHHENKWKRSYTLIKALNVNISDAEIERVNGMLPKGMSLRKVYDGTIARWSLILDVKPKYGLALIVR